MGKKAERIRPENDREPREQLAALPWRRAADGAVEILLITSRETRRWVMPKGWPIKGLKSAEAAAREAFEEAGIIGETSKKAFGSYRYGKVLRSGRVQHVRVGLYPMRVVEEREDYPEKGQREKRWASRDEAAALVDEPDLKRLLAAYAPA
jgi:8-oxo-dGTP pyrophosphatase MutT (NUDIX family)